MGLPPPSRTVTVTVQVSLPSARCGEVAATSLLAGLKTVGPAAMLIRRSTMCVRVDRAA